MAEMITSMRGRGVLLYAALLLVFASAWASDTWPRLTVPAILFAVLVVLGEAIALVWAARRLRSNEMASKNTVVLDYVSRELHSSLHSVGKWSSEHHDLDVLLLNENQVLRYRASRPSTWAMGRGLNDELCAPIIQRSLRQPLQSQLPSPIRNWKITGESTDAFNIEAGAFEIQHFHGQTNIRVIDPDQVTVEGVRRDSSGRDAPVAIREPVRH